MQIPPPQVITAEITRHRRETRSASAAPAQPVAVDASFEDVARWASAAFSALFTAEDPGDPFRFLVSVRPELAGTSDADAFARSDEASVTLEIVRLPKRVAEAPAEFRSVLFAYTVADFYISHAQRDFGVKDPQRRLLMDVLQVPAADIEAARRRIWN